MNRLVVVRCPDLLDEDENGDARRLFGRVVEGPIAIVDDWRKPARFLSVAKAAIVGQVAQHQVFLTSLVTRQHTLEAVAAGNRAGARALRTLGGRPA